MRYEVFPSEPVEYEHQINLRSLYPYLIFAVSIFGSFELLSIAMRPAASHFFSPLRPTRMYFRSALAEDEKARDMLLRISDSRPWRFDLSDLIGVFEDSRVLISP